MNRHLKAGAPWLIAALASALTIAIAARPVRVDVHLHSKARCMAWAQNCHQRWRA
jgi:hypothetical protein